MDNAYARAQRVRRRCRQGGGIRNPRRVRRQPNITGSIAPPTAEKKWYIVNTYSGHENKAKLTLLERVRNNNLTEYFGDVLVPTESVTENVKGQRRTMTRKFFPGYMFVQMVLDDRTFHLVKNTPKITGFLGGTKPTPVPEREIHGVQTNVAEGKAGKPKARVDVRGRRVGPRRRWSVRELLGQGRGSEERQAEGEGLGLDVRTPDVRSSLTSPRSRKHKTAPPARVRQREAP